MKKKLLILILLIIGLFIGAIVVVGTYSSIYKEVRINCQKAQKEFQRNCNNSLILLIQSENFSFREKNSAIWTLGQLADKKSLLFLSQLAKNIPAQERCSYDSQICGYEVEKAVKWCEKGNLTSFMYKDQGDWK